MPRPLLFSLPSHPSYLKNLVLAGPHAYTESSCQYASFHIERCGSRFLWLVQTTASCIFSSAIGNHTLYFFATMKAHTTSTNWTEGVFRGVCLLCPKEQCTGALCTIGNSYNYCRFARQFAYMVWTRISIICSRTSDVCLILTCCFLPSHIKNKACRVYTEMPIRYGNAAKKAECSSWNKSPNVNIAHVRCKVYFMTGDWDRSKRECAIRESNPGHLDGNEIFYH